MKSDKELDELFRSKLENFEQEPPAHLFDQIASAVEAPQRKRGLIFWKVAGIAAALLVAFWGGWQINQMSSQMQPVESAQVGQSPDPGATPSDLNVDRPSGNDQVYSQSVNRQTADAQTAPSAKQTKMAGSVAVTEVVQFVATEQSVLVESMAKLESRPFKGDLLGAAGDRKLKVSSSGKESGLLAADKQIIDYNQQLAMVANFVRERKRWEIGAQVSPVYNVSNTNHSKVYASNMLSSESSNPVELGGGLSVAVKAGKRLSVQSGVYYSALGQTSGNSVNRAGNALSEFGPEYYATNVDFDAKNNQLAINGSAGTIKMVGVPEGVDLVTNIEDKTSQGAAMISQIEMSQNFEYIEIPIYLRYELLNKRFGVDMIGGVSSNVLVGNQAYIRSNSVRTQVGETENMEPVSYSGSVGIGFKYGFSKRIFLNVEPRVKYYFNSLSNSSDVELKPYSIGVYTGLSYKF